MKKKDNLQKKSSNSGVTAFFEARQSFLDLEIRNEDLQTQIQTLTWVLHIASKKICKLNPTLNHWQKIAKYLETRTLNKSM